MPHSIFREYGLLCLFAAALSVLLSLWAVYLDPVINKDGIYYVHAAERFAAGRWDEALAVYKWPFYSFLIGVFIKVTGLASGHATYLVDTLLYVALVVGFIAFVRSLGGGGSVLWIAALVILFYPVMNKFRPFVIRDIGYWACYLWSLAYLFAFLRAEADVRPLLAAAVLMFLAFLFRIEGLALLLILPGWLLAARASGRRSVLGKTAAVLLGLGVLSGFTLWQHVSESGAAAADLLSDPFGHILQSWSAASAVLGERMGAWSREFGGILPPWAAMPVYAATLLVLVAVECAESLGIVYAGLVVYILVRRRIGFESSVRYWWTVLVLIQFLLLLAFGFLNFFLADRYPVGLALTLMAPLPFFLDELWQRWRARTVRIDWAPLLVAGLLAASSVEGLDVTTQKQYLRQAGLWLRGHGVQADSFYSNSVILSYYAGTSADTPRSEYSWEQAMKLIWTGDWTRYDYLALMIEKEESKHRNLILEKIEASPVAEFSNTEGDEVLIFSPGQRGG